MTVREHSSALPAERHREALRQQLQPDQRAQLPQRERRAESAVVRRPGDVREEVQAYEGRRTERHRLLVSVAEVLLAVWRAV